MQKCRDEMDSCDGKESTRRAFQFRLKKWQRLSEADFPRAAFTMGGK